MAPPPDTRDPGEVPMLISGKDPPEPSLSFIDLFNRNKSEYVDVLTNTTKVLEELKNVESDAKVLY